jgi:hypothetical protein
MATTTAMCTTGKLAWLKGELEAADVYKVALIKSTPTGTYDKSTDKYGDVTGNTDEVTGTGYSAGGVTLATYAATAGTDEAWIDWSTDPQWTSASFTASACMFYDDTDTVAPDQSLSVHDFGGDQTVTSGTFTLQLPANTEGNALLRFG